MLRVMNPHRPTTGDHRVEPLQLRPADGSEDVAHAVVEPDLGVLVVGTGWRAWVLR